MAFNFFGKKKAETPAPPDEETPEDAAEPDESEPEDDEEGIPEAVADEDAIDLDWRVRAATWIPGGASTGSKRPAALYGEGTTEGPGHFIRANGCHVTTASERTLIDCTMALGSVSLGYADDAVVRAVVSSVASGNVTGLASVMEMDIAERLCEVIPCAEQVRFLKTGAEAVSAAIRIARTATGRSHVVACGYFGWHDWSNTGAGIPSAGGVVTRVPFNDIDALDAAVAGAGTDLAAIVIEPVVEQLPDEAWLGRARALCDAAGAVLVFDEMKTGFRIAIGGYQQVSEVRPDLAVFGKAMACGFPLAAVVGQRDLMAAAERTWISSTSAGESAALAACGAVLDRYAEEDVCATLARVGEAMRDGVERAIVASGVQGISVHGPAPMWFLRFEEAALETRFLERAAALGVLFKRGAYNYAALAHDDDAILTEVERVASTALVEVMEGEE
ncbi:MAG: aminotransferase class III-fold pyridoxal phosphate-dependent enzyme [Cytophagaceae bacterium]|nr:aminotransferase class III-fold pyridoxal phosphate-dependent enzyme [Gemmatimonadaceae bacterium]